MEIFRVSISNRQEDIVNHGTDTTVVLTLADLNKVHVFENTSACTVTMPSVDAGHIGYWCGFRKKGAGNLTINAANSDTIVLAGDTSISNTEAGEIYAEISLILDTATNWGLKTYPLGTWLTT